MITYWLSILQMILDFTTDDLEISELFVLVFHEAILRNFSRVKNLEPPSNIKWRLTLRRNGSDLINARPWDLELIILGFQVCARKIQCLISTRSFRPFLKWKDRKFQLFVDKVTFVGVPCLVFLTFTEKCLVESLDGSFLGLLNEHDRNFARTLWHHLDVDIIFEDKGHE